MAEKRGKDKAPRKNPKKLPRALQWVFENMDTKDAKPPSKQAAQLLKYVQADPKHKAYVTKRWFDIQMEAHEEAEEDNGPDAVMKHVDNLLAEWKARKKTPGGGQ